MTTKPDLLPCPYISPLFGVGDIVTVVGKYEHDWHGQKLMITGVEYFPKRNVIKYQTHPADDPTSEGGTDEWPEDNLSLYQRNKWNTGTPNKSAEVDLSGLTLDKMTDIVAAFGADNDSESYPFNGEEYDIQLVRFAFEWLLRGNSHRLETIKSSGYLATEKGGDCETCGGLGRIDMLPDDGTHTHPCEDCQPEASAEWQRGYAAAEYKPEQVKNDAEDAAKWRALIASRMYCMGWAGFNEDQAQPDDGYRHICLNLWTVGEIEKSAHDLGYGWQQDVDGLDMLNQFIAQAVKNPDHRSKIEDQ